MSALSAIWTTTLRTVFFLIHSLPSTGIRFLSLYEQLYLSYYRTRGSHRMVRLSRQNQKNGKNGRRLAAAHGNLTPAHACGCAAQCFEGVQRGSLFDWNGSHGHALPHAVTDQQNRSPKSSFLCGSWRAVCSARSIQECYPSAYAAQSALSRCNLGGCKSARKGSCRGRGLFSRMHR